MSVADAIADARKQLERAIACIEYAQQFRPLATKDGWWLERAHQSVIVAIDWLDDAENEALAEATS